MTNETKTGTPNATDNWTTQFADLKKRFPKVREPIVVGLHILSQQPEVSLEDAKAMAAKHGVRITAASINGARRLLAQNGTAVARDAEPAPVRTPRPARASSPLADAEAMMRTIVEKLHAQSNAEAERLRSAMRKAIAALQTAVGDES